KKRRRNSGRDRRPERSVVQTAASTGFRPARKRKRHQADQARYRALQDSAARAAVSRRAGCERGKQRCLTIVGGLWAASSATKWTKRWWLRLTSANPTPSTKRSCAKPRKFMRTTRPTRSRLARWCALSKAGPSARPSGG